MGDNNSHLLRIRPELKKLKFKYTGKNFAFFNTESTLDSNLFSSWNKPDTVRGKTFGLGFGGSDKTNCRLWLNQDPGHDCFINYKKTGPFDGCLLYSLDKAIRKDIKSQEEPKKVEIFETSNQNIPRTFTESQKSEGSDVWGLEPQSFQDYPIEVVGLEAWTLMSPQMFARFNAKLVQTSTLTHYDKMIGINYGRGVKNDEVLIENSDYFTEKE